MPAPELDLLCAEVTELTRQPELSVIEHRASRRRLRRMTLAGAGIVVALVAGGGVAVASLPDRHRSSDVAGTPSPVPSEWQPNAPGPVRWAGTADGTHIYAVLSECPACGQRLVASDDGGRTWTTRPITADVNRAAVGELQLRGARTLEIAGQPDSAKVGPGHPTLISTDGGSTWTAATVDSTPVATVPAGAWLECHWTSSSVRTGSGGCSLDVVDPATKRVRPLAMAPSMDVYDVVEAPTGAGLWLVGLDRTTQASSVAVSRDGGATWSVHSIVSPGDGQLHLRPYVGTYDGTIAYAIVANGSDTDGYRSTDGGQTWQPTNGGAALPGTLGGLQPSIVLPDGTQVLQQYAGDDVFRPLVGVDGGARYVGGQIPGWPGPSVHVTATGGFVAWSWVAIHVSPDGRTWTKVTPR
jgi:hypothetical protein